MIYGIGTDIVEIPRMEAALQRWGKRFTARVFTDEEIAYCNDKANPANRFALRFAAKEAFVKALGTGFRAGLFFREVEVTHDPSGSPTLKLHGKSQSVVREKEIRKSFLSLSDDGSYALAFVVLES